MSSTELKEVISSFDVDGDILSTGPCGNGHINDTFLVTVDRETRRELILQRINHHVFKQPALLMDNLDRVCAHLRRKLSALGRDPDRHCLTLIPARDGRPWHMDDEGYTWRLRLFIADTVAVEIVESAKQAREAGRAFGEFQRLLVDLPGEPLHDTIPAFHDLRGRLATFRSVVETDPVGRAAEVVEEIAFVEAMAEEVLDVVGTGEGAALPTRITHNDTKINNVLLDSRTNDAVCVIDLDTVMSGLVVYDFGDSVRTGTNTGAEDDPDLSRVGVDLELFEAYTKGYAREAAEFLTLPEIDALPSAGTYMSFIIGLRFLTDHVDGDNYYRIHKPGHNLQRARAQFQLVRSLEDHLAELAAITDRAFAAASG